MTVEFTHMYTADYCLVIIPRTHTGSRKPLNLVFRLFSFVQPVDVSRWKTTMDLQPMHYRRSISVAFTRPDPIFEFGSDFRVDLLQVSSDRCNDTENYLQSWSMIASLKVTPYYQSLTGFYSTSLSNMIPESESIGF